MSDDRGSRNRRFLRLLVLIVFVTAVFLFIGAERLPANVFRIGVVAIGAISIVTAMIGFLIAAVQFQNSEPAG
jgi:hypothetical protein